MLIKCGAALFLVLRVLSTLKLLRTNYLHHNIVVMMMKSKIVASVGIALLSVPVAAEIKSEPLRLAASSKWHVDFAEDRCRLARTFGSDDQQVTVFFDRFGPGEYFRMTLIGKPLKASEVDDKVLLQFGPKEQEQSISVARASMGDNRPALVTAGDMRIIASEKKTETPAKWETTWLPEEEKPIDISRKAAVQYLRVGDQSKRPVILETGPLSQAFEVLDTCTNKLLTKWGIDVEKHRTLSRPAAPATSPAKWVTTYDYPAKMLRLGEQGLVQFRLNVGADGKPTECHIQATTRSKEFDDVVCRALMKRAQFFPALEAQGIPIASYYQSAVLFRIPN